MRSSLFHFLICHTFHRGYLGIWESQEELCSGQTHLNHCQMRPNAAYNKGQSLVLLFSHTCVLVSLNRVPLAPFPNPMKASFIAAVGLSHRDGSNFSAS